ncbi:putative intracellular septation protein [Serratia symbiotica str. 'Cinara cedri']|uniref:Inner membrane-spanning protein YciB n=1 Tax=Serratia symbiotica TaxID=138074 RepID=B4YQR9_9GAMM|nr:septation intracellular protein [Serratia symbiotica]AEW44534.1 putative intracellular septation protein [Serratia symbiotica str. 'Cinara cedri']
MKQFLDFIPLIIFFIFYRLYDIYLASGALMATSALVFIFNLAKSRKVDKMALITFLMVLVFGTLTLVLHDNLFIKWKVTVIYTLFSLFLLISQLVFKKLPVQGILGKDLVLSHKVWSNLNLAWAIFFMVCSLLNVYVAFWMPERIWVNFKVFGLAFLMLVFTALSGIYIYQHIPKNKK